MANLKSLHADTVTCDTLNSDSLLKIKELKNLFENNSAVTLYSRQKQNSNYGTGLQVYFNEDLSQYDLIKIVYTYGDRHVGVKDVYAPSNDKKFSMTECYYFNNELVICSAAMKIYNDGRYYVDADKSSSGTWLCSVTKISSSNISVTAGSGFRIFEVIGYKKQN